MKAVVLEIKDGYAAVLSEDGQFRKIKDDGYLPGMELTLEKKKGKKNFGKIIDFRSRRFWQSAATAAAALLIFVGVRDFNIPYGTISLDVNPSIEISINRYDKVLTIEAVNDDADEIVDELNAEGLKYKSIDDAVDMALSSFAEDDYAAEDGTTYVMISVNSKSDKRSGKIVDELENLCKGHDDISAQAVSADDELLERARELGTTAGKLYLVESLESVSGGEDIDESDWLKKPVKDIVCEITSRENSEPSQNAQNDSVQSSDKDKTDEPQSILPQSDTEKSQSEPTNGEDAPNVGVLDKPLEQDEQNETIPPDKSADKNESRPESEQLRPQAQDNDTPKPPTDK